MNDSSSDIADAFIFFGATGDLAYKQIFPALQALVSDGNFDVPVVGVAGRSWTSQQLIERAKESIEKNGKLNSQAFAMLSSKLQYVSGDYAESSTFDKLKKALGNVKRPLFYLAIPPDLFQKVVDGLENAGLTKNARVIIEKPFGKDLQSARTLNDALKHSFNSKNIFRLDHFLGKEVIQNLVYFHLANPLIYNSWSNASIDSVQITMAESFGVSDRGKLYDEEGAIRDVVQNHMLQTIACLAMEQPRHNDNVDLRAKRGELLRSIRTVSKDDMVRGQFRGYSDVKGVAPSSSTETFAAFRFYIDNPRWEGVPFYVRVGKCLSVTATEIMVHFKKTSEVLSIGEGDLMNYVRLRISPDPTIAFGLKDKKYGRDMVGDFIECVQNTQGAEPPLPYERLLGDAMRGDSTLFVNEESVESAWRVVDPVFASKEPLYQYEPGSWGPQEVSGKVEPPGGWHNPT